MRAVDVVRSRRVLVIALLGFGSGLPLLLTGQTLTAWMTAEGVSLKSIGVFSLVGLPYTFKWAWAPLLDRYRMPFLGRRRGWLLVLQLALMAAIAFMGSVDPRAEPGLLAAAAVAVAFLSASQDIVVDAFNADTLLPEERAAGGATYLTGYRAAMLLTGALALALADRASWQAIYWWFAGLMLIGVVGTLVAREPAEAEARPATLAAAVWRPVAELLRQPSVAIVLAFVALFKFGDHVALHLVIPFLKSGAGFSFATIALLYHLLGFAGTLMGGVLAGPLVVKVGLRRALFLFGALQALTNVLWAVLATAEGSRALLVTAVVCDNLANAVGSAAFVAYLMSRCDRAFSATQFALLTSMSSIGGRLFTFAGTALQAAAGWPAVWLATAAVALPALVLVRWLPLEPPRVTSADT